MNVILIKLKNELVFLDELEEEAKSLATNPNFFTLQYYTNCIIAVDECKRKLEDYLKIIN